MVKGLTGAIAAVGALTACVGAARADTAQTQNVWSTWSSTWRGEGRWGLSTDVTVRSTDDWEGVRSVEFRPGVTYTWSSALTLAGGGSVIWNNDAAGDTTEKRVWSQFAVPQAIGRARINHRVRVEERFIERIGRADIEATRVRYQAKAQIPFAAGSGAGFTRGNYGILQQEVFVHVAGARNINGHAFDQARLYAGIGRRFGPLADLELTYMHQHISGRTTDTRGHVVIATLTTRF